MRSVLRTSRGVNADDRRELWRPPWSAGRVRDPATHGDARPGYRSAHAVAHKGHGSVGPVEPWSRESASHKPAALQGPEGSGGRALVEVQRPAGGRQGQVRPTEGVPVRTETVVRIGHSVAAGLTVGPGSGDGDAVNRALADKTARLAAGGVGPAARGEPEAGAQRDLPLA